MVGVTVSDKGVVNFFNRHLAAIQLPEDAVTPTGIHQQASAGSAQVEAGVVAPCAHCVACAEHGDCSVHDYRGCGGRLQVIVDDGQLDGKCGAVSHLAFFDVDAAVVVLLDDAFHQC